jgi:proteic killer suppression protein
MVLNFEKDYLREMYENGKSSDKKHRFQPEIIRAYAKCLYRLEEAIAPEDLYKYQSLHFEALVGDKKGLYSVRVNNQYRVEFSISQIEINQETVETKITICNIIELSNHYK